MAYTVISVILFTCDYRKTDLTKLGESFLKIKLRRNSELCHDICWHFLLQWEWT